ncbi:hypothetical protein CKO25_15415 [Thiocapsa imhoffii]|uniref:Mechanosensitive ion channel n=1 Tax=Thiocapsa imhoffii TaxID=382777 RepID=A0A9X0WKY2_9GAMM|nr:mechanosensitive ion channel domain-containing protein [Thiocapsa imhoffii]MBK1646012.1 hypothetical protein [Thiocapsa imhoffii]
MVSSATSDVIQPTAASVSWIERSVQWLFPAWLLLATTLVSANVALPDLRELQEETRKLNQLREDIIETVFRSERSVKTLLVDLAAEERRLHGPLVETEDLRRARLDLESIRSRLAVIEGRIEQYRLSLVRLRQVRDDLATVLARAQDHQADDLLRETGLRLLREQESVLQATLAGYEELAAVSRRKIELLHQRLRLLQSRFSLAAVDRAAASVADERIPVLQDVIADFLRRAARASRDLDAVVGDTPSAANRRRLLAEQVNEAITRAFIRQNDLELVLTGNRLEALTTLRADETMPLRILRLGVRKLNEIAATLTHLENALNTQFTSLESRGAARLQQGAQPDEYSRDVSDLMGLMAFQREDIRVMRDRLEAEQVALVRLIGETTAASLLEHHPLPTVAEDWIRVLAAMHDVPRLAATFGVELWRTLLIQFAAVATSQRVALAIALPLLVALLLWAAHRLSVLAAQQDAPGMLAHSANALSNTLPWMIPAVIWGVLGWLLGLRPDLLRPILVLLSLVPSVLLLLRLTAVLTQQRPQPVTVDANTEVDQDDQSARMGESMTASDSAVCTTTRVASEGDRAADRANGIASHAVVEAGLRLQHHLRVAILVAAAIVALHESTHLLSLPPLLMDVLDRLGMFAVLALFPTALGVERALRARLQEGSLMHSRGAAFVRLLSRLLPGFVLLTGIAGVLGYTHLAWTLIGFSLWLTLVALGLYFSVGVVQALAARIDDHLRTTDVENAEFWRTHFVEPGRRLAQLGLSVGAGWILLVLWGWGAQTPPVRWMLSLTRTELFQLSGTPFTVGGILLTLLLIGAALWVGGWSQQVSYRLAYRRVRDLGLRQALATFTRYVVIVAGVLLALSIIGFDLTALTVFAASLGVGIGFGLQNIVNNFISGILLLAERPLRIGDFVSIGAHDGTVTQIGIRSLTVRTPDRQEVVIPNGSVISSEFINWTGQDDTVRQVHYFVIRYGSDRELAMDLIHQVLNEDPNVLKQPAPGVFIWEYTDRGVRLRVQFCFRFVHGPGSIPTRSAVLLEIGRRFAAAGIEFAEIGLLQGLAVSSVDGTT